MEERRFIANLKSVIGNAAAIEIGQILELFSYADTHGIFELTEARQIYTSVFFGDDTFQRLTEDEVETEMSLKLLLRIYRRNRCDSDLFRILEHCHAIGATKLAEEDVRKTLIDFTAKRIRNREFKRGLDVVTTMLEYVKEFPESSFGISLLDWLPAACTAVKEL